MKQKPTFNYCLDDSQINKLNRDDIIDVDLFSTPKEFIREQQAKGTKCIAYISVGSYETNRPDANKFDNVVIGNKLEDWEKERALNIKSDLVFKIMQDRIYLAYIKGFDGVELDNVNVYENEEKHPSGFNLTKKIAKDYFIKLSKYASQLGLRVILKNCIYFCKEVEDYFDYMIVENAFMYDEYQLMDGIEKPIFFVEYPKEQESYEDFSSRIQGYDVKYNVIGKPSYMLGAKKITNNKNNMKYPIDKSMTYYSQENARWGRQQLGGCNCTISSDGCYITSICNLIRVFGIGLNVNTPKDIVMDLHPGILDWIATEEEAYFNDCFVSGYKFADAINKMADKKVIEFKGFSDKQPKDYPVIARTRYGRGYHFIVLLPDGHIIDPLDENPMPRVKNPEYKFTAFRNYRVIIEKNDCSELQEKVDDLRKKEKDVHEELQKAIGQLNQCNHK